MSEITTAIKARQAQITQLQSDIETLQRAASVMGGGTTAPAKAVSQTTAKPKPKAKARPQRKPKRRPMTAAQRAAAPASARPAPTIALPRSRTAS